MHNKKLELGLFVNEWTETEKQKLRRLINYMRSYPSKEGTKRGYATFKYENGFVIYASRYTDEKGWRDSIFYTTDFDYLYYVDKYIKKGNLGLLGEIIYDPDIKINFNEMIKQRTFMPIFC